jgi:hypothetical protein
VQRNRNITFIDFKAASNKAGSVSKGWQTGASQ